MWLSLMLLMLGGVAHVFTGVEDVYGTIVATVLLVLMLTSCLTIVNNVQQFRNMYCCTPKPPRRLPRCGGGQRSVTLTAPTHLLGERGCHALHMLSTR